MIKFDVLKDLGFGKVKTGAEPEIRFTSESDLQKDPITEKTSFLYFIKRDIDGYKTGWVWSENKNDLVDFLLDVLIAKQFYREYESDEMNTDGFSVKGLQETFILAMASSLANQSLDPIFFSEFSAAVYELTEALANDSDLNAASMNLMDFTTSFFYSLTWSFFASKEEAEEALLSHSVQTQGDLAIDLLKDNSL